MKYLGVQLACVDSSHRRHDSVLLQPALSYSLHDAHIIAKQQVSNYIASLDSSSPWTLGLCKIYFRSTRHVHVTRNAHVLQI